VKSTDSNYAECQTILKNIEIVEKYYAYVGFGAPEESNINIGDYKFDNMDYKYLHQRLLKLDAADATTMVLNTENIKQFFLDDHYRKSVDQNLEVSEKTSQNVLYRIAKEIYGYTGKNNMEDLIAYFPADKKEMNGLYYDEKWYINTSYALGST